MYVELYAYVLLVRKNSGFLENFQKPPGKSRKAVKRLIFS